MSALSKMMKLGSSFSGIQCLNLFVRFPLLYSTSSTNQGNLCNSSDSLANYLVDSLGFSNTLSLSISANLAKQWQAVGAKRFSDFVYVGNANSVVHFLTQLGFQQHHIRIIISRLPRILLSNVDKTLKPKIKLLNDVGICGSDLLQVIVKTPSLLRHSLGPPIQAFRTVLGTDENLVRILKRLHLFNFRGAASWLIPNAELLQTYCAIPTHNIHKCILQHPRIFTMRTDLFRAILVRVEHKFGFRRDSKMFLYGIHLVAGFSEKNIEDKFALFKSFGWTQSDVMELIKRNPLCLTSAQSRIKESLDFLMNQLGYNPTSLASQPLLFTCSIEKRLLPRHRVLQILKEKGILRMNYRLSTAAGLTEPRFLKRFVLPFEEVHEVYAQLTGSTVGSLKVGSAKRCHRVPKPLDVSHCISH